MNPPKSSRDLTFQIPTWPNRARLSHRKQVQQRIQKNIFRRQERWLKSRARRGLGRSFSRKLRIISYLHGILRECPVDPSRQPP